MISSTRPLQQRSHKSRGEEIASQIPLYREAHHDADTAEGEAASELATGRQTIIRAAEHPLYGLPLALEPPVSAPTL
jgi:hypothetical protein